MKIEMNEQGVIEMELNEQGVYVIVESIPKPSKERRRPTLSDLIEGTSFRETNPCGEVYGEVADNYQINMPSSIASLNMSYKTSNEINTYTQLYNLLK